MREFVCTACVLEPPRRAAAPLAADVKHPLPVRSRRKVSS